MADSSDEFESDLSCESEYESVESSDEWEPITDSLNLIGSTANCTLNLPLRKHIFFAGNSKLKITRSVKTISQPKRERCSLLVMGSWCRLIKLTCVAGGLVRRRKIRWGEFDFWRHVEQIQKEEKNWREGGGGGTRKTACPQTSIFYFRLFVLTELSDQ